MKKRQGWNPRRQGRPGGRRRPLHAALSISGLLLLVLLASCSGGSSSSGPNSPSVSARPSLPGRSPAVAASPSQQLNGISIYSSSAWLARQGSLCAVDQPEAPYLSPEILGVHSTQLPKLSFPQGFELAGVRVCSDEGMSGVGYILADNTLVRLLTGAAEWPTGAPAASISPGDIAGRPAVLVAPYGEGGNAEAIIAEDFGLMAVSRLQSVDAAKQLAAALQPQAVAPPPVKGIFAGELNGVRFFDTYHRQEPPSDCEWGPVGIISSQQAVALATGSPLDIKPDYLPANVGESSKGAYRCGSSTDAVESNFAPPGQRTTLQIIRLSGEPAWYSVYSDDWYTKQTVAGRPAVLVSPPDWAASDSSFRQLVIVEPFGITVLRGGLPANQLLQVAQRLNR